MNWTKWPCWAVVVAASGLAACGDSGTGPSPTEPPANRAPEVRGSIPDQALTLGEPAATVNVANNFADPDGDALSYTVSSSNSGVAAASILGTVVTVQPVALGAAAVTVTARDAGGLTASLSFVVTVTGSPDLVASVSPNSVAVAPGGEFQVRVTVRNRGNVAAPATRVRTFASADSVVTTSDEEVGDPSDVPALGPGESAQITYVLTVDSSVPPGTYWLGECVDPVEGESDTDNNCSAALKMTVTGSPDLVVSVSPARVAVAPGGEFQVRVTVRNRGDVAAPATRVRTFASADSVVTTSDEELGDPSDVPALGPGESAQITYVLTVGSSVPPGTYWLGECVDPVEGESDTDNNCSAAIKMTVTGSSPDLVVSVSPARVAVAPGGEFQVRVTVRNRGDVAAPATRVRTFASADSVVTTSDEELGDPSDVPALGPGESAQITYVLTVGSSVPPGTYWLGECVDPVEGESDTDNNCSAAIKMTVTGSSPDLVVSVSPARVTVAPGGEFQVRVTVRNRGNVAAPATRVRTFASADSVVTTSDEELGDPSDVPALGPGESARITYVLTVGSSVSPGTYWLGECVDPVEGESDTDNNCSAAIKMTVTGPSPDLVASVSPDRVAVAPGGSFKYSVVTTSDEMVGRASDVPALGPGESVQKLTISATGGLRVAGVPVAQRLRGLVVRPTGQIEFGLVARSSRPSPAGACRLSSSPRSSASSQPVLCRSAGKFALVAKRPPS